jgi:hypothetical protein
MVNFVDITVLKISGTNLGPHFRVPLLCYGSARRCGPALRGREVKIKLQDKKKKKKKKAELRLENKCPYAENHSVPSIFY